MKLTRDIEDEGRNDFALFLLESSSYEDPWKEEIGKQIDDSTPDEIELIIEDLYLNQVDKWTAFRLIDINRRLDKCL